VGIKNGTKTLVVIRAVLGSHNCSSETQKIREPVLTYNHHFYNKIKLMDCQRPTILCLFFHGICSLFEITNIASYLILIFYFILFLKKCNWQIFGSNIFKNWNQGFIMKIKCSTQHTLKHFKITTSFKSSTLQQCHEIWHGHHSQLGLPHLGSPSRNYKTSA
jgi:hypothetical protein